MIDYANMKYTTLNRMQRLWLRVLITYYEWQIENESRLIDRVQDEVNRGIASMDELATYKRYRIGYENKALALRRRGA